MNFISVVWDGRCIIEYCKLWIVVVIVVVVVVDVMLLSLFLKKNDFFELI